MKTVKLRDATLNVADVGSGPTLLLVHGFPLDHSMWRHQLDSLSDAYRVIAPRSAWLRSQHRGHRDRSRWSS